MDNSNRIVPPHLNAEIYRTNTIGTTKVSYLDYIVLHKDGSVLIGQSELTGRYWTGGISVFKTVNEAKKIGSIEEASVNLTCGTADGCFVGSSNRIIICEDSGAVTIWTKNDDEKVCMWQRWRDVSAAEHDDAALAIDCLVPENEYVTVGADGNAKVWDINDMICKRNYESAHIMPIFAVSVRPRSTNSFATCSMDQYAMLWDDKIDRPVLELMKTNCPLRCIKWIDEHKIISGDEAGVLRWLDMRNTKNVLTLTEFPAAVHKVAIHPKTHKIAVCCDNRIVSVCELTAETKCNVVYQDRHMHSNYVRSVAWDLQDRKILHSLGWDGEMKSHRIE